MKMLFSSSDGTEVSQMQKVLARCGIPCAVRHDTLASANFEAAMFPELWLEKEEDYQAATILLATRRR